MLPTPYIRIQRGAAQGYIYSAQALGGLTALTGGAAMIRDNVIYAALDHEFTLLTSLQVGGDGGWRVIFYMAAALGFFSSILLAVVYRPIKHQNPHEEPYMKRLLKLDWVGAILLCLGIVPLMIGASVPRSNFCTD